MTRVGEQMHNKGVAQSGSGNAGREPDWERYGATSGRWLASACRSVSSNASHFFVFTNSLSINSPNTPESNNMCICAVLCVSTIMIVINILRSFLIFIEQIKYFSPSLSLSNSAVVFGAIVLLGIKHVLLLYLLVICSCALYAQAFGTCSRFAAVSVLNQPPLGLLDEAVVTAAVAPV